MPQYMTRKIKVNDYFVQFEETPQLKEEVFERCLNWFIKHKAFAGEVIMQSDEPLIDAPDLMADLADDVFKFEYKYE